MPVVFYHIAISYIQIPSSVELPDRQYYLTITTGKGSIKFLKSKFISLISGVSRGYLLTKTDKPIYKPSQTGTVHTLYGKLLNCHISMKHAK